MSPLNHWLLGTGILMFVSAIGILGHDALQMLMQRRARLLAGTAEAACPAEGQWRIPIALAMLAWSPLVVLAAFLTTFAGRIN